MKRSRRLAVVACIFGLVGLWPAQGAVRPTQGDRDELSWRLAYDDADRLTAITDPAGRSTRLEYQLDASQRVRKVVRTTAGGSTVTRELDERGRLVAMTDDGGVVSYGYDDLDRLTRVARQGSPPIAYTYDTQDRVKTLQVGDYYRIEYDYDFLNRLSSMDTPVGRIKYEYLTGQGKIVRTLPNGIETIWDYSAEGKLRKITHRRAFAPDPGHYSLMAEYAYTYRADGLIDAIVERSPDGEIRRSYQYDTLGRLVRAKGAPRPQYVYGYDSVGNRTKTLSSREPQKTFSYDWVGRLISVEREQATHDGAGNLTAIRLGGETWRYHYNDDNQLVGFIGGRGETASYRYDGEGRIIERAVGGTDFTFVPDPLSSFWKPIVMEGADKSRTLVVWDIYTPLIMIRDGQPEYLLHDHLGSVRLTAGGSGQVTQRINYEPYGLIEAPNTARDFVPRFAGLFWEATANLYLARNRAYSPWAGRFFQVDPYFRVPVDQQDNLSPYAYCGDDPVNWIDLDGARPETFPLVGLQYLSPASLPSVWSRTSPRSHLAEPSFLVNKAMPKIIPNLRFPQETRRRSLTSDELKRIFAEYDEYREEFLQKRNRNPATQIERIDLERKANSYAWDRLAKERSGLPFATGKKLSEIINTIASSNMGEFSLDYGASIHSMKGGFLYQGVGAALKLSRLFSRPEEKVRGLGEYGPYFFWKDLWIANREEPADNTSFAARYPVADTNAVRINYFLEQGGSLYDLNLRPLPGGETGISAPNTSSEESALPSDSALGRVVSDQTVTGPSSELDVSGGTKGTGSDKLRVYLTDIDYPKTVSHTMVGAMLRGMAYDGIDQPQILAYGRTQEGAEAMASVVRAQRPDAKVTVRWGDARSDAQYAKLKADSGADVVFVMNERRRSKAAGDIRPRDEPQKPPRKRCNDPWCFADPLPKSWFFCPGPWPWCDQRPPPTLTRTDDSCPGPWPLCEDPRRRNSGGGGPDAEPPPPATGAGADRWSGDRMPTSPSRVGGVYLGGTGRALEGIGMLDGVALDANNDLVLLDQAGKEIALPPLRLDDMVTVFLSVYIYGESPTVSIDPNPENPEGSAMLIRHGKGTEGTYVGWVLFQADRLMKGYTLGADNTTGREISTSVPGYDRVLRSIYFGGLSPEMLQRQRHWERFWIVFAKADRFSGDRQNLTLLDVPLKVKTQSMKWSNGELVDDAVGKSSPGALAFADWFTASYDRIARERYLKPPPQSGITEPVPVFTELRRIALITAIAEKLRDQGVPMPFWMRDYEVARVPFEAFTPGLQVTRSSGRTVARVYGGVQLAAEDEDVRDFDPKSDLSKLPEHDRATVREAVGKAEVLESVVRKEMKAVAPLQIRRFEHNGSAYRAIALPGADTRALAPARLEESDLEVPVAEEHAIGLVRSYNSFFRPKGPWGEGWALDLPRLEEIRVPIRREANRIVSRAGYELITPLNSTYARFARIEEVAALGGSRLLVPEQSADGQSSQFFGLSDAEPAFLSGPTRKLIRKDGGAWHFDQAGNLVAVEAGRLCTVYERDAHSRLTRIVGLWGNTPMASIELGYNASGQLESASGKRLDRDIGASTIRYGYSGSRLAWAASEAGRVGYRYQGPWVTAVTFGPPKAETGNDSDPVVRSFEYDPRGQLLREVGADGTTTDYRVSADADGRTVTVAGPSGAVSQTIRYDPAFRPVSARYSGRLRASWSYSDRGETALDIADDEGAHIARIAESANGRERTLDIEGGYRVSSEYDDAGRLTSLVENGRPLLEQQWTPDGRLQRSRTDTQAEHYEYGSDGLLTRMILAPPDESGTFGHWQETLLDPQGRPTKISDYSGLNLSVGYDRLGEIESLLTERDGRKLGYKIARDDTGRIQRIYSTWGDRQYTYDANGLIEKVRMERDGSTATAHWGSGLPRKVKQFDGGEISLTYFEDGDQAGLLKGITAPNGLELGYRYDQDDRIAEVNVAGRFRLLVDYDVAGRVSGWRYQRAAQ